MATAELDTKQLERFHEEGYLVLPAVFSPEEIRRMREEADFILDLIINSSLCNGRVSRRLDWLEDENGVQHIRKIQPINDLSVFLAEVSSDPRLIGPMRQLMEDEPVLMEEKLNYKEPLPHPVEGLRPDKRGTDRFGIHNDWAYYQAQNYPTSIISSAISMDDCTADNGPLHIWPGTHREHLKHVSTDLGLEIQDGLIDPQGGIDVLAPAGSVMLFHSLLAHNSRPNETRAPRRLMIYSHFPKASGIGFDIRNGPTRLAESPWEWEYVRSLNRGTWQDRFRAPQTA